MEEGIAVWLLKTILSYVISRLVKKAGISATASHIEGELIKSTPLPADPNPSPASLRNPPHYGG